MHLLPQQAHKRFEGTGSMSLRALRWKSLKKADEQFVRRLPRWYMVFVCFPGTCS